VAPPPPPPPLTQSNSSIEQWQEVPREVKNRFSFTTDTSILEARAKKKNPSGKSKDSNIAHELYNDVMLYSVNLKLSHTII
jgi:hypothetical protein